MTTHLDSPAPATVVVIDDSDTNRHLIMTLMKYQGHRVFEATDGREGLELARRVRPQLVISDIVMPTMDGYEFVRQLRADPRLSHIEVIFYTAHYHEREAQKLAAACDVARVLTKPCEPTDILAAVEEVLSCGERAVPSATVDATFDREHLELITNKLAEKAGELQIANERLTALTELNLQLASERDLHHLLEKVCYGARKLFGARYAVLAVTEKYDAGKLIHCVSGIENTGDLPTPPLPADDPGPLGRVFSQRVAWRSAGPAANSPFPPAYPQAHVHLAVPIGSLTHAYGWLCLADKIGGGEFTAEDEHLIGILGAQSGRIYENGSLHREVQMHAAQLQVEIDEREIANAALRQVEERFRQIAENIQDVFFIISVHTGETIYLSPAFERIWGRRANLAEPLDWAHSIHREDRQKVLDQVRAASGTAARDEMEYRIVLPGGEIRWIQARYFPIRDALGKAYRLVGIATDVTERKQADLKIRQLNRVYAVLSGINSLIVRATTQDELFGEACRLAVKHGEFILAWIGVVDGAASEITPVACAGDVAQVADAMIARTAFACVEDRVIAAAVATSQPQICDDLEGDETGVLFRSQMLAERCRSLVALPLVHQGATVACLVLASDQRQSFDEAEMRLLSELAEDISFALDHIDKASQLDYLAYYDSLTGFANRALFLERLAQNISVAAHGDTQFLVVVADLERFDTINDTYGRKKGDALLKEVAERFSLCIGDVNAVARVAPDHFAAIIPFAGEAEVIIAAFEHKYQAWLGAPFTVDGMELRISARSGIAVFPHDAADGDALLKCAEAALKRAKTSGDKIVFFTKEISEKVAERLSLETQLRRAIDNQEFVLHYQAKVDLETRGIEGVEALIRWRHPHLGLILPGRFIGILEETGMIVEVGAWALRRAALDRRAWVAAGLTAPRIAVNVSSVQVRKADFVAVLVNALEQRWAGHPAGLGAAGIDIEVTESLLLEHAEANIAKLTEIRRLGVGIAIDDFGTGYSSLSYLAKLPVACLKIDRSFTATMLDDPGVMTLVSTMIALAHSLKLKVVAEGVELEEQAKILRLLRCDQMQGYLIGKPVPFETMTERLRSA